MSNKIINEDCVGEQYADDMALVFFPEKILLEKKTKYQNLKFIQTKTWGKILFIDDLLMKAEYDGHIINEMIVHPVMLTGNKKKKCLVVGGGEGWTATELLKYPYIEQIDIIDIDGEFVEICKTMFPEKMECLRDSRVHLIIQDGLEYIKNTKEIYDAIFITPTDPLALSLPLFCDEFIKECHNHLSEDGIYQVDSYMPYYKNGDYDYAKIQDDLSKYFSNVRIYTATIPTFPGGLFAFCMASKKYDPLLDQKEFDFDIDCKYYNKDLHRAAFSLPQFMINRIREVQDSK